MGAIFSRVYLGKGDEIVTEYLMRDNALMVEHEWVWQRDRWRAWVFHFRTHGEEVAEIERHSSVVNGRAVRPWAVNLGGEELRERLKARGERRVSQILQSAEDLSPAPEPPALPLSGPGQVTGAGRPRGVSPQAMAAGTITERGRAAKQNRRVARERAWEKMRGERTPQEVYEETERRCGS